MKFKARIDALHSYIGFSIIPVFGQRAAFGFNFLFARRSAQLGNLLWTS